VLFFGLGFFIAPPLETFLPTPFRLAPRLQNQSLFQSLFFTFIGVDETKTVNYFHLFSLQIKDISMEVIATLQINYFFLELFCNQYTGPYTSAL